ncbi:GYDIA family GHMP kinase [Mangrovimonas spongiae]|uniref:GHMP kinase n=1 Tax=Mangrovimonas spongiae TaxID=2494697 RepID=A0A3R9P113_9FLAO|nr:GYDIA family GHMP kinase [Mangrovimonas spongiae]RSK41936.1 GHMP kinase [Mangrovimonas spongiae]
MKTFRSQGKLLLTAEYLVLDGAKALALPTRYGQSLNVTKTTDNYLLWKSFDNANALWYENTFQLANGKVKASNKDETTTWLLLLLNEAKTLNPDFLNTGHHVESYLTFPRDWGLGSSSTLINNIAQWANVDPFLLSEATFGGSGYDIACASAKTPITYQLFFNSNKTITKREISSIDFNPSFKDHLYFVHLNKKQNSRDGIKHYRNKDFNKTDVITKVNNLTNKIISATNISLFNEYIDEHEMLIGTVLNETPIKERVFPNFNGSIKSLGAWGGDFILVSSLKNPTPYFLEKGYKTIIPYNKMIL